MFGGPQRVVGMLDPHINETVTHLAEMDFETNRRNITRLWLILAVLFSICFPCVWCMVCMVHFVTKSQTHGAQVYLTDHNLVCTRLNRPQVTIPLANIASTLVQPGVMTVNIKPTAPEVMLKRSHTSSDGHSHYTTTYGTRSVPIRNLKNAEEFAKVVQSYLH